ncbi:transcription factor grauzone-like [Calliphora vicina]|uniref:transcription factor grauzone-like n=1 Tax=Calliphora vicina TaxID=7373 RepID=UPI00325BBD2B
MNCLLCFKVSENIKEILTVNSADWQEQNIQHIVEKYLWKMEHIKIDSHVCLTCWKELYNFHRFYTEIEKSHKHLNSFMKTDVISDDIYNGKKELLETNSKENVENYQLEPEILLIKQENPLEVYETELVQEFNHVKRKIKRKCSTKKVKNVIKYRKTRSEKERIKAELADIEKPTQIAIKLEVDVENDTKESNSIANIEDQDDISCESDDEPTNTIDSAKTHIQRERNDKFIAEHFEMTNCSFCQIPLATFSTLIKHFKEEHNERGYALCCNRKYYTRTELIDHIKWHINPEHFKCKYCDKILSSRVCLKLHIKNVHDQMSIECDICGKSLANVYSLKTHKLLHVVKDNERIPCTHCDKSFVSKQFLDNHISNVHLKKYHKICDLCGVSILEKQRFKRHMLEHQGKPLPKVSCEVCGRLLSDVKCLKRHMNSHHPPEGVKTEIDCPICKKMFANRTSLKNHIKVVHENSCESKCTMCEKTFKRPDALKDHMAKHIGKPLHACGWCPKSFYSNGQMHAHRKSVHPMEWQESVREKHSGNLPEKYISKSLQNEYEYIL